MIDIHKGGGEIEKMEMKKKRNEIRIYEKKRKLIGRKNMDNKSLKQRMMKK